MCGIFGMINYSKENLTTWRIQELQKLIANLLDESEMRGKDASGICILSEDKVSIFKDHIRGRDLKNYKLFKDVVDNINITNRFKSLLGHTRAQTKGDSRFNINNHPIIANKTIGVHNGIIGNDDLLFSKHKDKIVREGEVDSEIIFRLIDMYIAEGKSIEDAVKETSDQLLGGYACAFINLDWSNYLTLFKGSTYPSIVIYTYNFDNLIVFASSSIILSNAIKDLTVFDESSVTEKLEIGKSQGVRINIDDGGIYAFDLEEAESCNSRNYGINGGPCTTCELEQCLKCPHFATEAVF